MPKRKKSALEKFFSFKRHRRRFGAKDALDSLVDFDSMKRNLTKAESQKYTHGSENDLLHHLKNLNLNFTKNLNYFIIMPSLMYFCEESTKSRRLLILSEHYGIKNQSFF